MSHVPRLFTVDEANALVPQLQLELAQVAKLRGELTTTIEALVPQYMAAVPKDPFDGKPLRLAQTDQGIVIYSVDEDEKDDGGMVTLSPKDKTRKRAPDLGLRLHNLEHRGILVTDESRN